MEILDVGLEGRRRAELEKHSRELARLRGEKYVAPKSSGTGLGLVMLAIVFLAVAGIVALVVSQLDAATAKSRLSEPRTPPAAVAPGQHGKPAKPPFE